MDAPLAGTMPGDGDPVAWWAIGGVLLLFASAALRLGVHGIATMRSGLAAGEWLALASLTLVFVYGEGVRALQRRYVPHVLRRVARLARERRLWRVLAPLYALSLVGGPRRTVLKAWAGTGAIVLAVIVVRSFPEPWRGIIDFAVAAALAWGAIALAGAALHRPR